MDFGLTSEQQMLVDSIRAFVDAELKPYEEEVERTNKVRPELIQQIHAAAIKDGFYAANMPEELGGGGLDHVALTLMERELGRTRFALQYAVARPSNILRACQGEQSRALPAAGDPRRAGRVPRPDRAQCRLGRCGPCRPAPSRRRRFRHQRHQALHLLRRRGRLHRAVRRHRRRGHRQGRQEADHRVPGRQGHAGPRRAHGAAFGLATAATTTASWSSTIAACTAPGAGRGGQAASTSPNQWLGATRLTVAAQCVGRAQRAMEMATPMGGDAQAVRPDHRQVPGHILQARRHGDRDRSRQAARCCRPPGRPTRAATTDQDAAMAKLFATEMLARVTDQAVQIFGGMGLMDEARRRAVLARCAGRAHLGRHHRDPAPHHLPGAAAAAGIGRLPFGGVFRRKVILAPRSLSRLRAHTQA